MKYSIIKNAALAAFFFSFLFTFPLSAAHLVGGEITYTCVGGNNYEVRLRVYRDCNSSGAQLDASVTFTVFNAAGTVLMNPSVNKGATINVSTASGNPCLTTPPNICTQYADYITTLTLPPLAGGYTISYQRCCRNATITNISNPGTRGNTYTVQIPSNDVSCNSAPVYTTVPPIVLCLNDQLNIDASAMEPNSDSLYYELCDILNGGSSGNATPSPAAAPPYTPLTWVNPYTSIAPLSGTFTIDPMTGFITGKASQTGQFVVGICVSEYRNGILLSTVRRDYQFNVTACISNVVGDMLTQSEDPSLLCGGRTLQFQAQTPGGIDYFWNFGDTNTTGDTAHSPTPTYVFPDTGWYDVTLIINPGLVCTDTVVERFHILDTPNYAIQWTGTPCFEVQDFWFEAQGTTPVDATFSWEFGPNANFPIANGDSVGPIDFDAPGTYPIKLIVHSATCPDTLFDSIQVIAFAVSVDAGPDIYIAKGDTAHATVTAGNAYRWFADKPVYFNHPRRRDPSIWPKHDSTAIFVLVTNEEGCVGLDTVMIYWLPLQVNPDLNNVMNLITPNGDNKNDFLDLAKEMFLDKCTLIVYNRWGAEVFRADNYSNNWFGTNTSGDPLPTGTYYFYLLNGIEIRYKGPITIAK